MENGHPGAEMGEENAHQLGSQGDLRHQDQGSPALLQHLLDQADIHLGLPASGDAVQQGRRRPLRPGQG